MPPKSDSSRSITCLIEWLFPLICWFVKSLGAVWDLVMLSSFWNPAGPKTRSYLKGASDSVKIANYRGKMPLPLFIKKLIIKNPSRLLLDVGVASAGIPLLL
jgi:hypothetical protein